jgi:hypothetical protein
MDNVVPHALQRLRAADIIRMAGLTVASLGQEYCRIGAVHSTKRQGARLSGIVDVSNTAYEEGASPTISGDALERVENRSDSRIRPNRCTVEIELLNAGSWATSCSCHPAAIAVCQHAAALLYQWLAHPQSFVSSPAASSLTHERASPGDALLPTEEQRGNVPAVSKQAQHPRQAGRVAMQRAPTPVGNLIEILGQLGLNDLRGIAREYDIPTTGVSKPQLVEAMLDVLKQPEAIRRVAAALDKPLRQLLATITLAGGSITDDDLSGIFERFSLGHLNQLQPMLATLQGKGLLFRTNLNNSLQQRGSLSRSLLDIGWFIPPEVRAALRVMVPVTSFNVQDGENGSTYVQQVKPYSLLADLLLTARALDGYRLQPGDEKEERSAPARPPEPFAPGRNPGLLAGDGSDTIPPPGGIPGPTLLARLQAIVSGKPAFLRFAVRLLRLADILYKDDAGTPYLRVLSNAAQLLLGPAHVEVMQDLFDLWLTSATYEELFDLQEEGLRLHCRATPLNYPVLRPGELEAENSEARQWLVALLAQAPLNQWISFPAFARFVYRLNPSFLQRRQRLFSSPHWWLEQEEGRALQPTQFNDWVRAEGRYLSRLLRGPLHWWGVSDLAMSSDGRLLAFRLTPIAGLLLGSATSDLPAMEYGTHDIGPLLEVWEDGELAIACTSVAWPLIELLEDFAEVAGVRADRLCYRLAPKSLSEALSQRKQPAILLQQLRNFLRNDATADSPLAHLLAQLERWIMQYGRVRLYIGVTLLEVADTLVMRELTATTSVEEQIVQAISPTLLILKRGGSERIVDELKRHGQAPLVHEEEAYGTE